MTTDGERGRVCDVGIEAIDSVGETVLALFCRLPAACALAVAVSTGSFLEATRAIGGLPDCFFGAMSVWSRGTVD